MPASHSPAPAASSASALVQNLAGIALGVMLVALGIAYVVDQTVHPGARAAPTFNDSGTIVQNVAGRELTIPASWFRFGEQMQSGFVGQVDLSVRLQPGSGEAQMPVDVTLLPRSRAKTSSELLDAVYVHQFSDERVTGVPGLVGQRLKDGTGFDGETIWYDAIALNPFVAKCITAVSADAPDQCVRTVHLPSGLAAIFSFDASLLPAWREFDAQMAPWLEKIGAE